VKVTLEITPEAVIYIYIYMMGQKATYKRSNIKNGGKVLGYTAGELVIYSFKNGI